MCRYTASRIAEVAQLVEHRSEKPGVDSSILSLGTFKNRPRGLLAAPSCANSCASRPSRVELAVAPGGLITTEPRFIPYTYS